MSISNSSKEVLKKDELSISFDSNISLPRKDIKFIFFFKLSLNLVLKNENKQKIKTFIFHGVMGSTIDPYFS